MAARRQRRKASHLESWDLLDDFDSFGELLAVLVNALPEGVEAEHVPAKRVGILVEAFLDPRLEEVCDFRDLRDVGFQLG